MEDFKEAEEYVKKLGEAKILEFFDIFKKNKNWLPIYCVQLSSGDIVEINQTDIKPNKIVKNEI